MSTQNVWYTPAEELEMLVQSANAKFTKNAIKLVRNAISRYHRYMEHIDFSNHKDIKGAIQDFLDMCHPDDLYVFFKMMKGIDNKLLQVVLEGELNASFEKMSI
ncbi:hypothetical protein EB118_18485 [bacterium]|nr:hypothetical protein [bacterium]NDD83653.1 hypothetical protein [bacterium]NDG32049.1 hypothetical protein [bacterium]